MAEDLEEQNKEESKGSERKEERKKINPLALISYIGVLCLIPLFVEKKDEFVKFHTQQGLALFIAEIISGFIMFLIPVIGWALGYILNVIWVILAIVGIVNVLNGKKKELPLIGKFAKNFKI